MSPENTMLVIQALDPGASVNYSTYTRSWYVSASIEIGNGSILSGVTEHCENVFDAIAAFFNRIADLPHGEYVVTRYHGRRREWRWNGAAFAECTRDEVFAREAERDKAAANA